MQKISGAKRVNIGAVTPGRESFRQARNNGGMVTKHNGNIETGSSNVSSTSISKDPNTNTSLNIDKTLHSSKGQMRR